MFKICPCCQHQWKDLNGFVTDTKLTLNGYQANFNEPLAGFFLFTHNVPNCKSTMTVPVQKFSPILHNQLQVTHFVPGLGACPKLCLDEKNLSPCPNKECPGHHIRQLLNFVKSKLQNAQS